MKKTEITGVILAKDESQNLKQAIKSLVFCKEVIVVDDNSSDDTKIVAMSLGARVLRHELSGDFAAQRNYALSKATSPWVFFLDADEVVSSSLSQEITKAVATDLFDGYKVQRQDYFCGKLLKFGETGNIVFLRLARKGNGIWHGVVHEEWKVNGKIGYLTYPLYHYPHPTVTTFLNKINWYTNILALAWQRHGRKVHGWEIIVFPGGKFIANYFWKLGFLDGTPGFIMAMMMSFHSFLVRAKLWLKLHPGNTHA
ncbi:glycosyltransferase family 2 protein [Candidatus Gottesmanbacteria bacterium]|nr:glycosyltransferase family 2 protein [Candidatus Gottesmanbacteria bacterium]